MMLLISGKERRGTVTLSRMRFASILTVGRRCAKSCSAVLKRITLYKELR